MNSLDILDRLIAFPTVSRQPNCELIRFVEDYLSGLGIECQLVGEESGTRSNLYAVVGPRDRPGVMLSGHSDVVPIEGQDWTREAFRLTRQEDRFYGRGTADMKGFVACALRAMALASKRDLKTPLLLALSYDEEIGCVGVRKLIAVLADAPIKPAFCIVGEPTGMAVATGHKGKTALRASCEGREGHSALAPLAVNAVYMATDLIQAIRAKQAAMAEAGARDEDYDVPYTTLHVGTIAGGVALNIVPKHCSFDFEIRNLAEDDPAAILEALQQAAASIVEEARAIAPEATIRIETVNAYPGLATAPDAQVVNFVKSLTGANATIKVAFGTEAGLFSNSLGVQAVVCGPGSMAQGHKPDEFVTLEQIERCDAMLLALLDRLEAGL